MCWITVLYSCSILDPPLVSLELLSYEYDLTVATTLLLHLDLLGFYLQLATRAKPGVGNALKVRRLFLARYLPLGLSLQLPGLSLSPGQPRCNYATEFKCRGKLRV